MTANLMSEYEERNDILIVRTSGSLAGLVDDWAQEVEGQIRPECRGLVLNLASVEFISSRGLGILLHFHKFMTGRGGRLHLASPAEAVTESLEIAGLDSLLYLYQTEDEAVAAF